MKGPFWNAHVHVFTARHVPSGFLPLGLVGALRHKGVGPAVDRLLRLLAGDRPGALSRVASFCRAGGRETQEEILVDTMGFYPSDTRFAVLPMDFEYMRAGECERGYVSQLEELALLRDKYAGRVRPFVAADPRRANVTELVRHYAGERGFAGVKVYPTLGFWPFDARLDGVYAYAEDRGLPVVAHCSRVTRLSYRRGPVAAEERRHPLTGAALEGDGPEEFAANWGHPDNWAHVLKRFPRLRLCLAHAGGAEEWAAFLETSWPGKSDPEAAAAGPRRTWLEAVLELVNAGASVYADVAYTLSDERLLPLLKVLLASERQGKRFLYGSDSYMTQMKGGEREFAVRVRGYLGEELFGLIARDNPERFLS